MLRRVLARRVERRCRSRDESADAHAGLIEETVARAQRAGLIDDARFAAARLARLRRRGTSTRQARAKLSEKGIDADTIAAAIATSGRRPRIGSRRGRTRRPTPSGRRPWPMPAAAASAPIVRRGHGRRTGSAISPPWHGPASPTARARRHRWGRGRGPVGPTGDGGAPAIPPRPLVGDAENPRLPETSPHLAPEAGRARTRPRTTGMTDRHASAHWEGDGKTARARSRPSRACSRTIPTVSTPVSRTSRAPIPRS